MGDREVVGTIVGNHRDQSSKVLEINWKIGSAPRRPHRMLHRDRVGMKASAWVVDQTVCVLVNFRLKDVRWVISRRGQA